MTLRTLELQLATCAHWNQPANRPDPNFYLLPTLRPTELRRPAPTHQVHRLGSAATLLTYCLPARTRVVTRSPILPSRLIHSDAAPPPSTTVPTLPALTTISTTPTQPCRRQSRRKTNSSGAAHIPQLLLQTTSHSGVTLGTLLNSSPTRKIPYASSLTRSTVRVRL